MPLAVFVLGWVFLRYFEHSHIYYPVRSIEFTPKDVGLDYQEVNFKSQDAPRLNGWFIPSPAARATLLFCHGNGGNISHRIEIIKLFHELGLNVFIFDYRGYGRSRGWPTESGLYNDAKAAYDYLISRPDVNKERIILYGKSLGGNVAIDLATRVEPACLISESAFTSSVDMAGALFPFLPAGLLVTQRYDAISKIPKIKIPKLIIHSLDDEIVPFQHGRRLFNAAALPKKFFQMHAGHNEASLLYKEEFKACLDSFLREIGI
jgi:hypothetical protein